MCVGGVCVCVISIQLCYQLLLSLYIVKRNEMFMNSYFHLSVDERTQSVISLFRIKDKGIKKTCI